MALVNIESREINCKIVYIGAVASGKTENLKSVFQHTSPEVKAGVLEFDAKHHVTRYFEFLPISMGDFNDFHLKVHLYTLPVHQAFNRMRPIITRGLDAYVFVVDSRVEQLAANLREWNRFKRDMALAGQDLSTLPAVLQYNRRDNGDVLSIPHLRQCLNELNLAEHEAVATKSIGTMETLNLAVKGLLDANSVKLQPTPGQGTTGMMRGEEANNRTGLAANGARPGDRA